ncbi:MAG: hypothetical protein AB1414_06450 [bacterium]
MVKGRDDYDSTVEFSEEDAKEWVIMAHKYLQGKRSCPCRAQRTMKNNSTLMTRMMRIFADIR